MHLHEMHLHHSRLVSSRKWVYLRCASPLLSTHQVAGHSCCRPNTHTGSATQCVASTSHVMRSAHPPLRTPHALRHHPVGRDVIDCRHAVHVHVHAMYAADSIHAACAGHCAAAGHAWIFIHTPLALRRDVGTGTRPATALVRCAGLRTLAASSRCMRLMLRLVALGARLLPIACASQRFRQFCAHAITD